MRAASSIRRVWYYKASTSAMFIHGEKKTFAFWQKWLENQQKVPDEGKIYYFKPILDLKC